MVGARVGEIELLRNVRSPSVEEIGPNRDDETGGAEVETRPRDTVGLSVRRNHGVIRFGVVADVRRHAEAGKPGVEKRRKASRLVLIDEDRAGCAAAAGLAELLREDLERFIPGDGLELAVLARHRSAVPVGVVQSLERGLAARA